MAQNKKHRNLIAVILTLLLIGCAVGIFLLVDSVRKEKQADNFFAVERPFNFDEDADRDSELAQKLLDEYKTVWFFDGNAYSLRNKKVLVKTNIQTGEEEELYRDNEGIDTMYLEPEMAYIKKGTSLYRLYIPTRRLEKVFTDEGFESFYPISNIKVRANVLTSQFIQYIKETGDTENIHGLPAVKFYELNTNTGEMIEIQ